MRARSQSLRPRAHPGRCPPGVQRPQVTRQRCTRTTCRCRLSVGPALRVPTSSCEGQQPDAATRFELGRGTPARLSDMTSALNDASWQDRRYPACSLYWVWSLTLSCHSTVARQRAGLTTCDNPGQSEYVAYGRDFRVPCKRIDSDSLLPSVETRLARGLSRDAGIDGDLSDAHTAGGSARQASLSRRAGHESRQLIANRRSRRGCADERVRPARPLKHWIIRQLLDNRRVRLGPAPAPAATPPRHSISATGCRARYLLGASDLGRELAVTMHDEPHRP